MIAPFKLSMVLNAIKGGSLPSKFKLLRARYERQPSDRSAEALEKIIGTTTPITDVFASMRKEFDPSFYLDAYPDVASHRIDAELHYLLWGWRERRTPSKFFDPEYYARQNSDLRESDFPLAHYVFCGRPKGKRGNPVADHTWHEPSVPREVDWSALQSAARRPETVAVVIIPVSDSDETLATIFHALQSRRDDPYSLLIVGAKNSDEKTIRTISDLAQRGLFEFYVDPSEENITRQLNFALTNLSDNLDVVILHSDTYLYPGWFRRMARHANRHDDIATVVPLSNNALICSYPIPNHNNYLALELSPRDLDQLAATANEELSSEAQVTSSSCLYIRRSAIDQVGIFDADSFDDGRECDFALRAMHIGLKNIVAGDVFTYRSKSPRLIRNLSLEKKHPNYRSLVRRHLEVDSEQVLRRNLDAQRLVRVFKGVVLIITHKWGGGIETYVQGRIHEFRGNGRACLILRVHDLYQASFEDPTERGIFIPNLNAIDLRSNMDFIANLIVQLETPQIHVNSFAGLEWPIQRQLLLLLSHLGAAITYVGHDYAPISHYHNLTRPDNIFTGVPDLDTLVAWNGINQNSGSVDIGDPIERRSAYTAFFTKCSKIEVPSNSTYEIYKKCFPEANITVVPHADRSLETTRATRRQLDGRLRIVIVGAIPLHKGSDILAAIAADARNKHLPIDYHLVGYSDNDGGLESLGVKVWGKYTSDEIAIQRLSQIQPDLALIPSIVPETFCYALSIVLKMGIPPVVFDLGAQAERVRKISWGAILPLQLARNPARLSTELLSIPLDNLWANITN